jgi:hypothetical protein
MKRMSSFLFIAALAYAPQGAARPTVGARAPQAQATDADGNEFVLKVPPARAVLVLYEDKGSADQNLALKRELSTLSAEAPKYRAAVGVVAVADVSSYDFWPVRGFVAGAIRDESRRWGTTIFCDWSGAFRNAFEFARGVSNVVLLGKDGRIRFAASGSLADADRAKLLGMIRAEADSPQ